MPNPASAGLPNPASYDTATPGVVIDNITGLMWERAVTSTRYSQADAATYCTALGTGGFSNWRRPTRIELVSIVDFTARNPAVNGTAFPGTPSTYFWTSSIVSGAMGGWFVDFSGGYTAVSSATVSYAVRCVRGTPQPCPGPRFTVTGGWVGDATTKLNWQQTFGTGRVWDQAKADCTALGNGARLPSLTELQTIVDDSKSAPEIDPMAFPGTPSTAFWTSSLVSGSPGYAWYVGFNAGYTSDGNMMNYPLAVRCVR